MADEPDEDEFDFMGACNLEEGFDENDIAKLALYGPGQVPGEIEARFAGLAIGTESNEGSAVLTADLSLTRDLDEIREDVEESADVTVLTVVTAEAGFFHVPLLYLPEAESAVAPAIGAVADTEPAVAAEDEVRPSFCLPV